MTRFHQSENGFAQRLVFLKDTGFCEMSFIIQSDLNRADFKLLKFGSFSMPFQMLWK